MRWFLDRFWSEYLWLPPGATWKDLENGPDKSVVYADEYDLLFLPPLVLIIMLLRYTLEKYCFEPLGKHLGVKEKIRRKAPFNQDLEVLYQKSQSQLNYSNVILPGLSKKLEMTDREIARWWRLRRHQANTSLLPKFRENLWRASFLFSNTIFAIIVLKDKEWVWDVDLCFVGYPHQGITQDVKWYLLVTAAYYLCSVVTHHRDAPRSYSHMILGHHLMTLTIWVISWLTNFHRFCALAIALHDMSDAFLEVSKAMQKAKVWSLQVTTFLIFITFWFVSRMYLIPVYVMYSLIFRSPVLLKLSTIYFMGLVIFTTLIDMYKLNVYWSWLLVKIFYKLVTGKIKSTQYYANSSSSDLSES